MATNQKPSWRLTEDGVFSFPELAMAQTPEMLYRMLVERIPAMVYLSGPDDPGDVRYVSPQVKDQLGFEPEEWLAKRRLWKDRLHPDDRDRTLEIDRESGHNGESFEMQYRLFHRDGHTIWVSDQGTLLRNADGDPLCWLGFTFDISDQKRFEEALRAAEARYRTLVEQISVVTFVEPLASKAVPSYVSPQMVEMLGYSQETWQAQPDIGVQSIHPDDYAMWEAEVERTDRDGEQFDLQYRMLAANGRVVWVHTRAQLVHDEAGQPEFWQGTMQDITEAVLADQRLAESEQRFRSLFDHNPDPVYSFDLQGIMESANNALSDMTGYSIDEMLGTSFEQFIAPEDVRSVTRHFMNAAKGESQYYECTVRRKDGSTVEVHVTNLPIVVAGEIVGVYGVAKDISERKELERRLKHMAFHDPLTGLPNRLLFMDRLQQALASIPRRSSSIAVLFVDLDNFKFVNDNFGHDAGDQALRHAAEIIRSCVRTGDTTSRLGGDEFTVLVNDIESLNDALEIAGRILQRFDRPIPIEGHDVRLTASIGVVLSSSSADDPETLIRRGDKAMYQAKAGGKSRYEVYAASDSGTAAAAL